MLTLLTLWLLAAARATPAPAPATGAQLTELGLAEELQQELRTILRKSKQVFGGDEEEEGGEYSEELARQRQLGLEQCEVTGFETNTREECEEVSETECRPITLTKYRTEIVNKCEVKTDKECDVTFTGKPSQRCEPRTVTKCSVDLEIVEEAVWEERCHVRVQHLCEEYVPVPVPVAVPVVPTLPPPPTRTRRRTRPRRSSSLRDLWPSLCSRCRCALGARRQLRTCSPGWRRS